MGQPLSSQIADSPGNTWQEIERLVDELAALAQSDIGRSDFYAAFLDRTVRALAASGGCAWQLEGDAGAIAIARINFPAPLAANPEIALRRARAALAEGKPLFLPPLSGTADGQIENPSPYTLVVCPIPSGGPAAVVVEVLIDAGASPDMCEGVVRLLAVLGEVAGDYHRRQELQELRRRDLTAHRIEDFVLRIHESLDPLATAYVLANDGRQWIGCDRLCVVESHPWGTRLTAVSGVDHVDRRSQEAAGLARLAAAIARIGEPLVWSDGRNVDLPPQVDDALQQYVDRAHCRRLIAMPLRRRPADAAPADQGEVIGVLVAESFDERLDEDLMLKRVAVVARHGASALGNALAHHELPLVPLQTWLGRIGKTVRRRRALIAIGAGLLALLAVALAVVPAEFTVPAQGELQPKLRRHLFAPADGVVERVSAEHGQALARGSEVLALHDVRLELEHGRVSGELATTQVKLAAVRAKRSSRGSTEEPRQDERQLAAEEEQLKQQIAGLQEQRRVLDRLQSELRMTSPIDGVVLTWNVRDLLLDRPVKQGQRLLTIADPHGPWILELRVADGDVGHLLDAQRQSDEDLSVAFLLGTDAAATYRGKVERVAMAAETSGEEGLHAQVIVRLDDRLPPELRAGAGVSARIQCGKKPIGYVWLHDLIDAIRSKVLF